MIFFVGCMENYCLRVTNFSMPLECFPFRMFTQFHTRCSLFEAVRAPVEQVQNLNLAAVNEAVNDIYYEAEDHENLRQSVDDFDNFDQPALAQRCSPLLLFGGPPRCAVRS